jgi:hypothetical protein
VTCGCGRLVLYYNPQRSTIFKLPMQTMCDYYVPHTKFKVCFLC